MIHVVIPAAGNGRRFTEAGWPPKPHVLVDGTPMLRRVVGNIRPRRSSHRVTVVVSADPPYLGQDVEVVRLDQPTSGAVETILRAGIGEGPLLVANCDQLVDMDTTDLLTGKGQARIVTFDASSPSHSYVKLDDLGFVRRVAEKQVISDRAIAGVYFFEDGREFADAAEAVLKDDRRVLGEHYVSTVLSELVDRGMQIATVPAVVHTLGTPEELEAYHARGRS